MNFVDSDRRALGKLPANGAALALQIGDSDVLGTGQEQDRDGTMFVVDGPATVPNGLVWNTWNTTDTAGTLATNNAGTAFESITKDEHARNNAAIGPWDSCGYCYGIARGRAAQLTSQHTDPYRYGALNTTLSGAAVVAVVMTAAIPDGTPTAGTLWVTTDSGAEIACTYTSFTGSTFTITATDFSGDNATAGNVVRHDLGVYYAVHYGVGGLPLGDAGVTNYLGYGGPQWDIYVANLAAAITELQGAGRRVFFDAIYLGAGSNDANSAATITDSVMALPGLVRQLQRALAYELGITDQRRFPLVWQIPRYARSIGGANNYTTDLTTLGREGALTLAGGNDVAIVDAWQADRASDNIHLSSIGANEMSGQMVAARTGLSAPLIELP